MPMPHPSPVLPCWAHFLRRLLLVPLLGLWGALAWAAIPPTMELGAQSAFMVSTPVATWIEPGGTYTVEQVAALSERFQVVPALHRAPLDASSTLWVHLRLARQADAVPAQWTLNIPLPFVDDIRFFYRTGQGVWQQQLAGDTLAQSAWSQPGPYADFSLTLPDTQVHDVYVRIRNFKHLSVPIRLATAPERALQRAQELAWLGLLLGVLGACTAYSLVRYAEHRSAPDLGGAGFSALVLLTTAEANGVLNLTPLAHWPALGNYAYAVLPMVAIGAMLLMLRVLYALSTHYSRYDRFLRWVGWAAIATPLLNIADRTVADTVGIAVFVLATSAGLVATFLSWRASSRIWYWLAAAYVPQYLCLIRITSESWGLLPTWWEMRYALSLSMATAVPVLLYALAQLTHERKEMRVRARHLSTQDALTGLLSREAFVRELENAYDRVVDERQHVAVVLVNVANYDRIRSQLGDAVADSCLLQAVVKLYRVARDVDPVARIAPGQFGLILEGVSTEKKLNERMVQLIATGLTPLRGIHPPVMLTFHAACLLLHENLRDPHKLLPALERTIDGMSLRTRRPIRYLEPVQTQPWDADDSDYSTV